MKKIIQEKDGKIKVVTVFEKESKTNQSFKEQCDVNNILKKYRNTGELSHVRRSQGQYLDSSNLPDYQKALQTVIDANQSFSELPSTLRKRFNNNPQEMINFLSDPSNRDEAISLGLINKPASSNDDLTTNHQPAKVKQPKAQSPSKVASPPQDAED